MKRNVLQKMLSLLLAICVTAALLPPVEAYAAGDGLETAAASDPVLPPGKMWAYVSNHGKWGLGTQSHALKLYKLADSSAVSGNAAVSIEDGGIYLIGDTDPVGSSDKYRKMYAQAGATDSCGESAVPGDPYTLSSGCQSHKTNHMFRLTRDSNGWYTIQSLSNNKYLDASSCAVGDYNQISFGSTPTKFAVVKDGTQAGMFTIAAAADDPDAPPNLSDLTEPLYGAIVDDDLQYVQKDWSAALNTTANTQTLSVWRNDTAVSQILLAAGQNNLTGVAATAGAFSDGNGHTIAAGNVDLSFIKVVKAYTGMPGWGDSHGLTAPTGNADAAEVLMGSAPVDMAAGKAQGLWVSVNVPKDAEPGRYQGEITVTADGLTDSQKLTFTYTLNIASPVLPDAEDFKDGFDIELWQNPYASAEYYNVTPFSTEHFAILTPIMEKYKSIGGHAVTATIAEDAWARQTYSQNEVHIPSMVKWSKTAQGAWSFDYTDFDQWIRFNKALGIGDKIVCYSIAPWTNEIRYLDAAGTKQVISKDSTAEWNAAWTAFLTDLMAHMEAQGWKDETFIGIDERGFSAAAFDLIDSVKGTDGKPFKTAGAMDGFVNKRDLAMRVDDLNVGSIAVKAHPAEFAALLADRKALGLRTTVYSCTGHIPGNFSLSAPGESYWTMMYSYSVGGAGFLRWAYDSWVADPLRDTSHAKFEAGDCFLIFPDEKTAEHPAAHSSLRLEKMAQGVRDVNKLMVIKENCPAMESAVDALLASVRPTYDSSGYYLTEAGKEALAADMKALRQGIADLTEEYEERLATGDTKKLNMRPTIPLVRLPKENQSDVDGPYAEGHERQYLGQPDMIMLPDETLVTVFPVGHGHGPLVMKKSTDRGESWTEIETPASWARSLETPTMYRLNMTDGTQKYVMITARPNWDYNAGSGKGGWDASISSDGLTWSESTTYHEDIGYTIVAMASLVQLRDEVGDPIDKWMGVFHNYGFYNYKTYLTFDEQGNMQWSEPELYLSEYRALEDKYHICEVGMFRAPDDSEHPNRIVALARSDYHNNVHASTMFWSDDEGETWSKPVEMQGALAGERHKALYDPISGRLVITFREIIWDTNGNGVFEGGSDWLAGDWIAWVGTYEDLMERNEGQYRILLDEDWANNTYSGDTGYSGVQVYPDGTFVLDSYGHWDKEFSQSGKYDVRRDRCWIRQAKFNLAEMDALYEKALEEQLEEIPAAVLERNASSNSWKDPASGSDGGPAWAFDTQAHWWHSNYGTATAGNVNGVPSETNPIWIQTGFEEPRYIKEFSYLPRPSNGCIIQDYEVQLACLDNPAASPTDADFVTVKTGSMDNTTNTQTITLNAAYKATHIRLVAVGPVQGGNSYVTAQRIRIYAAKTGAPLPPDEIAISGSGIVDGAVTLYTNESRPDHTIQLTAAASPDGRDQAVIWTSTHPEVATVDETGLVTAVGSGTAAILAAAANKETVYASCTVHVATRIESITVKKDNAAVGSEPVKVYANSNLAGYPHSITLTAETDPANPTHPALDWIRPEGAQGMIEVVRHGTGDSASITATISELNVGEVTVEVASAEHPEVNTSFTVHVIRRLENPVSVTGTAKFGQTLTANTNQLVMKDAAKDALSYQWKRDGADIPDAVDKTYDLVEEDIGSVISVDVTADPATFYEGTKSASMAGTVAKADGPRLTATPTHEDCTEGGNNDDGKITGLFKGRAYEYKLVSSDTWIPFSDMSGDETGSGNVFGTAEITGLVPGNYHVRRAETDTHEAGPESYTITILGAEDAADVHDINIARDFDGGRVLANTRRAPEGAWIELTVVPAEGYRLAEDSLIVTYIDGEGSVQTIAVSDGVFEMPAYAVTVVARFEKLTFTLTHNLRNITCDMAGEHSHEVEYGDTPTIVLTAAEGYTMPSTVAVTTEDGTLFGGYRYSHTESSPDTARLIFDQGITENLTVTGEGVVKRYAVNYTLRNGLSAPEAPRSVDYKAAYSGVLVAGEGYALPERIGVTMGGVAFSDFVYDRETGGITIETGKITGNLVITASGVDTTVPVVPVTGVELNRSARVVKGGTITLTAVVVPDNATEQSVIWTSSDESVAAVDENGVVTGVAEGSAVITVTTVDGGRTAACTVTVTNDEVEPAPIPTTPPTTTTVEKNEDGSTTTTVTDNKTGTVTKTTEKPDGSKEIVETKKDGTVTETTEKPDGSKEIVETRSDGAVTSTAIDAEGAKTEKAVDADKNVAITVTDKDGEVLAKVELPAVIPEPEEKFIDVPEGHWSEKAINDMAALGVVNGVGGNRFNRNGSMKRGDLALILSRMSNAGEGYELTFTDVPADKYYANGVAWAATAGVVTGRSEDTFKPEDTITREELAVMLYRYAKLLKLDAEAPADALDAFADGGSTHSWAVEGAAWCVKNGILQGKGGGVLDPRTNVTRAEVAVMLQRFIDLVK